MNVTHGYSRSKVTLGSPMHDASRYYRTGWTPEEYLTALDRQGGRCCICGTFPPEGKALHADHCHKTGKKRGLLCMSCNNRIEPVLTRFMEDPDFRAKWEAYLAP